MNIRKLGSSQGVPTGKAYLFTFFRFSFFIIVVDRR